MSNENLFLPNSEINSILKKTFLPLLLISIIFFSIHGTNVIADDDENDDDDDFEDISSNLGWASIGLFALSSIYILFYQLFRFTRNFSKEDDSSNLSSNYRAVFLKIRKPLLYIHYFAGFLALILLLIHGIFLSGEDGGAVVLGWVTGAFYIFYIITGIILWLKVKPFWNIKKIRKGLTFIHRSMILFLLVIIIHIVHLFISD